ncbi:MAG: T9SS type A sorting domain-containing protein [Ignavibacteriaceae bacterium]|nr:T9SS type A sorting domain-containing protein [Ignavibacteriaceae bacterium]
MKNLLVIVFIWSITVLFTYAQTTSQVFYNGRETPEGMWTWLWGFAEDPYEVDDAGYTPGTAAFRWATEAQGYDTQGIFFGFEAGFDMTAIWNTASVHFKIKAPNGVSPTDTMIVWLYDTRWNDWVHAVYYRMDNYQDLNDGEWHYFSVPLSSFLVNASSIDKTDIAAVSFEAGNYNLISEELFIDDVWIGNPDIHGTMTIFNGMTVVPQIETEVWGFQNNNIVIAEGEGYAEGTNAIVWENNTTPNYNDAGIGFSFNPQQFAYAFTADTFKIKIKAPAGINDLALVFWDQSWNVAVKIIDDVVWDGEWKILKYALADFTKDVSLDLNDIYYFSIGPAGAAIPERILIDDIWIGNPFIDFTPPPAPQNFIITKDNSFPYTNFIYWDNIDSETDETYDVYASFQPITDLNGSGVSLIAGDVSEGDDLTVGVVHRIYYPLQDGELSYYYAVNTTDAAGNESLTFTTIAQPFTNTAKERAIISLNAPNFVANGDLSEWQNIKPFYVYPEPGRVWGEIDDEYDYSAYCYVAMDNENLYVAFDVIDDLFTYKETNTKDWWEDEAIEFFFGLYELNPDHTYWERGEEPDYRVVFKPYEIELLDNGTIDDNTENYYFEPLGESDYVLEAKIPFSMIHIDGDATFTPVEGMTIPFEIFATDADATNQGAQGRLQFGYNPTLDPWGWGPEVWTFAWVGMPNLTDVEDGKNGTVHSYKLFNNYPNPFNPTTNIKYQIAEFSHVSIKIYDLLGREVANLVNEQQAAGSYNVKFNGMDLASGIYFYQIKAGSFIDTQKMVLLR